MNKRARLPDRIHHLPLHLVAEGDRLRPVSPERVREIMASWDINGQLTPIEVSPPDAQGMHTLVAGGHRLAAARELGEPTIAAIIADAMDDDRRRLREIDENLYRAELSPFDQAVFLAARQEIYERLHGERRGRPKKTAETAVIPKARTFAAATAEEIGLSERTVFVALSRFSRLSEESRQRLRGTRFAENGAEIDALCKRTEAQQRLILDMVLPASGEPRAATIRAACAVIAGASEPSVPDLETIRRRLERLFLALPKGKARRDFAAWAKANLDADAEGGA